MWVFEKIFVNQSLLVVIENQIFMEIFNAAAGEQSKPSVK